MSRTGPDPNSSTSRIRAYFERNPGEYLTYDDIAVKFGISRDAAMGIVTRLRGEGVLQSEVMVYAAPERVLS